MMRWRGSDGVQEGGEDRDGLVEVGEGDTFAPAVGGAHVPGTEDDDFIRKRRKDAGFRAEGDRCGRSAGEGFHGANQRGMRGRFKAGLLTERADIRVKAGVSGGEIRN